MPRTLPLASGAIALLCVSSLVGCSGARNGLSIVEEQPALAVAPQASVTVLAIGDSLADGAPASGTPNDPGSWVHYLGDPVRVVGGWSRAGATTADAAANAPEESAEVLALLIGTNDAKQRFELAGLPERIEGIVSAVDVQHVVLSEIPPYRYDADTVDAVNIMLDELATEHGWTLIDAWAGYRDAGAWAEGGSPDGTHGSDAAYRAAGAAFTDAIVTIASRDR